MNQDPRKAIGVLGAREHNLRDVTVWIPRGALVAVCGPSGSGKSSLVLDTLYAYTARRFVEHLGARGRRLAARWAPPDCDAVAGAVPAVALRRDAPVESGATVATLTEIDDWLRLLFGKGGTVYCPSCDVPVESFSHDALTQWFEQLPAGSRVTVLAPRGTLAPDAAVRPVLDEAAREGFTRVRVGEQLVRVDSPPTARPAAGDVAWVVDRIAVRPGKAQRFLESLRLALRYGDGQAQILVAAEGERERKRTVSLHARCPQCGWLAPPRSPAALAWWRPGGWTCPTCLGSGEVAQLDWHVLERLGDSTLGGALAALGALRGVSSAPLETALAELAARGVPPSSPIAALDSSARAALAEGTGSWEGLDRWIAAASERARSKETRRVLSSLHTADTCGACEGTRLDAVGRGVRLAGTRLAELLVSPVEDTLAEWAARLEADSDAADWQRTAARTLGERARALAALGVAYLEPARGAARLSSGERSRVRLAALVAAELRGVAYLLDEPVGSLRGAEAHRVVESLRRLRDRGNTVVVVEHNAEVIRAADWVIEMGPGAGRAGGRVVAQGPPESLARGETATGRWLRHSAPTRKGTGRRRPTGHVAARGLRVGPLFLGDVELPLGVLCAVTGPSGSGKSLLLDAFVAPALGAARPEGSPPTDWESLDVHAAPHDVVAVASEPPGRSPRSTPATYLRVFDAIRNVFASTLDARLRGWTAAHFSFNAADGACPTCRGDGSLRLDDALLPDVTVRCDACGGTRYRPEVLAVRYRGWSIADVLAMTAAEAAEAFGAYRSIAEPLRRLCDVGLDYLQLGQPMTTVSGGEAQRLRLVRDAGRRRRTQTAYLLDEPAVGLHPADVGRLIALFDALVDRGHSVVAATTHPELLEAADAVVELPAPRRR